MEQGEEVEPVVVRLVGGGLEGDPVGAPEHEDPGDCVEQVEKELRARRLLAMPKVL